MKDPIRYPALLSVARSCHTRRRRRDEHGASLVEFAIVLPVFALMLFGMIQFGLAFVGWDQLRNGVETGARVAANANGAAAPTANCGQTDLPDNLVCQIAFLIGAPVDTSPTLVESSLAVPPSAGCNLSLTSTACSSYTWLDGYYVFHSGQWLQIVNGSLNPTPSSGQVWDSQAFQYGVGKWTCTSSCTSLTTNVTGQNEGALGSDNVALTVENSVLEVCAQRQVISFTAFPGLQNVHLSSTSSFYLSSTLALCGATNATCSYPNVGSTCG